MTMQQVAFAARVYAPYDKIPTFWIGYHAYSRNVRHQFSGVEEQAYDRGMELAMKLARD